MSQHTAATSSMTSDYDNHSSLQLEANTRNLSPLTQCLFSVSRPGRPITIADFGSATGLNSMKTFAAAIREFREKQGDEVVVFHVDLPGNAWEVLYRNAIESPHSYVNIEGTYFAGIGRSNFARLFPASFLSIGYCTFSLHWLSRRSTSTQQLRRFCENEPEILEELRGIAKNDLENFLRFRAEELIPGGRLLIQSPVSKLELDAYYEALAGMVSSGICDSTPLDSFSIPWHLRSEDEFRSTIQQFPQYRTVCETITDLPDPFIRKYNEDGDKSSYVDTLVRASRTATEKLFTDLFQGQDRLIEEFYARIAGYVGEHIHAIHTRQMVVVLEKVAE